VIKPFKQLKILGLSLIAISDVASATIHVTGWPFRFPGDPSKGDLPYAADGAFGRLACPSLTRLDLKGRKSEPLLLRDVEVESPTHWRLVLKSGLFWWSGKPVEGLEFVSFLRENLCLAVAATTGGDVSCPAFDISETPSSPKGSGPSVRLVFKEQPDFGPYVFNGLPFYRPLASDSSKTSAPAVSAALSKDGPTKVPVGMNVGFECAGLYSYGQVHDGVMELVPSRGYPATKRAPIRIHATSATLKSGQAGSPLLAFSFASDLNKGQKCTRDSYFPSVVGILWNDASPSGLVASSQVRKALTQILPRGELSRAGSQGLGELVTSVIPRQHPGYNQALRIRTYSVEDASAAFDRYGWLRATADSPRLDKKTGKPVVLHLAMADQSGAKGSDLLQKVIGDSFALVGIQTTFVARGDAQVDGVVGNFSVGWPDVNFLAAAGRKTSQNAPSWQTSALFRDAGNIRLLKSYALSLTTARPDFSLLQKIHERLYDAELFSPVFQVGVCVERSLKSSTRPDFADPDWFRSLVL
jgi:hypothetical protein